MEVSKELKGITPTFQMVLNKQIGDAMDAINDGQLHRAFSVLRTLIDGLAEEHSQPFLDTDIPEIERLIHKAQPQPDKQMGFYRKMLYQSSAREEILGQSIRLLFRKVMRLLHEEDYLEVTRRVQKRHFRE